MCRIQDQTWALQHQRLPYNNNKNNKKNEYKTNKYNTNTSFNHNKKEQQQQQQQQQEQLREMEAVVVENFVKMDQIQRNIVGTETCGLALTTNTKNTSVPTARNYAACVVSLRLRHTGSIIILSSNN